MTPPPAGSGSGCSKKKPAEAGGWCGSTVQESDIASWWSLHLLPSENEVTVRLADDKELVPAPQAGERVVFSAHLERGMGLPVSDFLREFLAFYGLRLHHLDANAIVLLSYFVAFCESFLSVKPTVGLFRKFMFPRTGKDVENTATRPCGSFSIGQRPSSDFPKLILHKAVKLWQ